MFLSDILKSIGNKKELLENFCSLSALNILNIVLPLVTLPYLIRVVGIEKYGTYSFAFIIIQYVLLISTYGFNLSATKLIAEKRADSKYVSGVFNAVIVCRLLLALFSYLFFLLISFFVAAFSEIVYMVSFGIGIVLGDALTPVWLFQGMGKMRYLTIVNTVSKVVFTLFIFVFISTAEDFRLILFIQSLGYLLAAIAGLFIAKKIFRIHFFLPSYHTVFFQLKDSLHIFLSTIGINLYRNSNILLLGVFSNEYIVGIYSAAEKIIKGAQSVISPVTDALFPYLSKKFSEYSEKTIQIKLIFRISKFLILVYIGIVVVFYLVSPIVVSYLFSQIEDEILCLLYIMTPVILLGGLAYVFGILGLYGIGKKEVFFKYVVLSGCTSVVVLCGTVYILPLYSGGIAMLSSEFMLCCLSFFALKRSYRNV